MKLQKEVLRNNVCAETVVRMTMLIVEQLSNKYMQLYKKINNIIQLNM
ncbi:hypothetical protein [Anoxybacillus pushchinoensis]|nr:hypothetical protein [Anoxybacillus pushchinoensis]